MRVCEALQEKFGAQSAGHFGVGKHRAKQGPFGQWLRCNRVVERAGRGGTAGATAPRFAWRRGMSLLAACYWLFELWSGQSHAEKAALPPLHATCPTPPIPGHPSGAVFLSYASQDAEAAKRICEALRAAQVEVWFDQSELVGGDQWDGKIRGQISSCALFVPIISANTQARREGYFRLEWKLAAQRTHMMSERTAFLLPVIIDATRDAEADVPGEFRAVQFTRLPGGETPPVFCERLKALLDGEQGPKAGRPAEPNRGPVTSSPHKTRRVLARARCDRPRGGRLRGVVAAVEGPCAVGRTGSGRGDPGGGIARESEGDPRQARCFP